MSGLACSAAGDESPQPQTESAGTDAVAPSTSAGSGGASTAGSSNTGVGGASGGSGSSSSPTGAGGKGGSAGALGAAGAAGKAGAGGGAGSPIIVGDAGPAMGTPGVWENVTPGSFDLKSSFGVQDVLADPTSPGTFYAFVCMQGVWKSVDWGATWSHVSTDGNIEKGKPWGEAIAQDGSYMLVGNGNVNGGAWRSTDHGATWVPHDMSQDNDPYMFDIDPADKNHVISSMHNGQNIFESTDGGVTWADKGPSGAGGSNYVFFITKTNWLTVSQDGGTSGTRRTTNSGGTWTKVGDMVHAHGNEQIFIDPNNSAIYVGSHAGGVYRSTDGGASFSQVSNIRSSGVFATGNRIYSTDPGANGGGTAPMAQSASRTNGADWAAITVPTGMTNGAKRAATVLDAKSGKWVVVTGNWNAGIWRLIEN
jgi:hypothetical protein